MTERHLSKWDNRFVELAIHVSGWSKDPSRKVGAVIADSSNRIVSIGFNGFPAGVSDFPERYENRDLKLLLVKHAEDNAIFFARGRDLSDCTLYSTLFPCSQCAGSIVRAGIDRIVVPEYAPDDKFAESFAAANLIFQRGDIDPTHIIKYRTNEDGDRVYAT